MKVRSSVKVRCDACRLHKRKRVLLVTCSRDKSHKQRQG